tara:strand:- start:103 stop:1062 length:960 start_codon:yes stop_codon:yes gene_type:complete
MKNTLYTLALLVSFSSFGQFSEGYFESINDIIPPFDKCSEDFFINDEYLIDSFLETLESSEDSLYLTNTQRTLFGKKLTLHWAKEEVEFLFDYYNRFGWDTDLDTIEQSDKELIVYDIKEALIKVSFSQKKLTASISYNGCEIESYNAIDNRGREKNHSEQTYNSADNILNILMGKNNELITINFSDKTAKSYTNDILVSESLFSVNGVFTTAYLGGVKDYTEEFDEETQIGKWQSFYPNGNLETSGNYDLKGGAYGNWEFYSNKGNYTANADLDDKYKGKIKDSAEIYKSGVFLKKVRLKNKGKGKLLDLLNELDSDN